MPALLNVEQRPCVELCVEFGLAIEAMDDLGTVDISGRSLLIHAIIIISFDY